MWTLLLLTACGEAPPETPEELGVLRVGYADGPHAATLRRAALEVSPEPHLPERLIPQVADGTLHCAAVHAARLLSALPAGEASGWRVVARLEQDSAARPGAWLLAKPGVDPDAGGLAALAPGAYERAALRAWLAERGAEGVAEGVRWLAPTDAPEAAELAMLPLRQAREVAAAGSPAAGSLAAVEGFSLDDDVAALGQTLLICGEAALARRGAEVEAMLVAYKRRLDYERALPDSARLRLPGEGYEADAFAFEGLGLPRGAPSLVVDARELEALQALLAPEVAARPLAGLIDGELAARAQARAEALGPWRPEVAEASPPARLSAVLDRDGDGRLSKHEVLEAAPERAPKGIDKDRDGFVSEEELRALLWRVSPMPPKSRLGAEDEEDDRDPAPRVRRYLQSEVRDLNAARRQ
jgi:hypothetical protein